MAYIYECTICHHDGRYSLPVWVCQLSKGQVSKFMRIRLYNMRVLSGVPNASLAPAGVPECPFQLQHVSMSLQHTKLASVSLFPFFRLIGRSSGS